MSVRTFLTGSLCVGLLALGLVSGCRKAEDVWPTQGKKRILASFPPLYCFAKNVAADDVDIRCLLTAKGPHDYQGDFRDQQLIDRADVILINGLELDNFVYKFAGPRKKHRVVEVGEAIPHEQLKHADDSGHMHEGHKHGEHDPHVWLGPPQAKAMVRFIAAKLGTVDPGHKTNYEQRAQAYIHELDKMHEHGKAAFKGKKSRNFISTHDSLQYFADAFGLTVVGHIQPRAGVEADGPKLTGLVKICKEHNVRVIAVEPQYSKGPAEALKSQLASKGIMVELVEVDPLETAPAAPNQNDPDPAYYLERMYRNIDNLAKALQ